MDPVMAARPTVDAFSRANYVGAVASRVESDPLPHGDDNLPTATGLAREFRRRRRKTMLAQLMAGAAVGKSGPQRRDPPSRGPE